MEKFAVVEVGSTITKTYIYENDRLTAWPLKPIDFKNNYKKNGHLDLDDLNELYQHIYNLKEHCEDIYIYGTSVFRILNEEERLNFLEEFKQKTNVNFNIVSAEQENEYTVQGVISNIDYKGKIGIMIGGGGSVELSIVEDGKIIEQANSSFGASDIVQKFPDLQDDYAKTSFEELSEFIASLINKPKNKAELLVLAGGDFIYFYETVGYQLEDNTFYNDPNQPYMIDRSKMKEIDKDFLYNVSLKKLQEENIDMKAWWSGATRSTRMMGEVFAEILDSKYVIPTRINMIYGIIAEIKKTLVTN